MSEPQPLRSARLGDACGREFINLVSKAELKKLSEVDSLRFTLIALLEVLTAAAAIAVSVKLHNPVVYVLAAVVLGSRINAMGALMHDAAHYRAYKTRWLNEIVGELLALPTTASMAGYRSSHFAHHRALNGENDPDWTRNVGLKEFVFPVSPQGFAGRVAQYLCGWRTLSAITGYHGAKIPREVPRLLSRLRLAFFVSLIAASIYFGFWKLILLYWAAPMLTVYLAIRYLRNVAEHYAVEHDNVLNESRTVVAPFWERWLIAPWGLNYHLEHHLYPSVPMFRLHELHELLMSREPFPRLAHVTHGYFSGLFRDCAANVEPAQASVAAVSDLRYSALPIPPALRVPHAPSAPRR